MQDFDITQEMVDHAAAASSVDKIISALSPQQIRSMYSVVRDVTLECERRYGASPTEEEIIALDNVQTHVTRGVTFDRETALYSLERKCPRIAAKLFGGEAEAPQDHAQAVESLNPAARMNYARAHGLS